MVARQFDYVVRNIVRVAAVLSALAPAVAAMLGTLPWEWSVTLSAVALTAGEAAQRVEDSKTLRALLTPPPIE